MTSRVPEMPTALSDKLNQLASAPNQFEDLFPKTKPLTIAEYAELHAHDYDWWTSPLGWLTIALIVAGVLLVLALLFIAVVKIAMKLIYWTAFAASQGAHNGWNEPPPRSIAEGLKAVAMSQWKAGAERPASRWPGSRERPG